MKLFGFHIAQLQNRIDQAMQLLGLPSYGLDRLFLDRGHLSQHTLQKHIGITSDHVQRRFELC